MNAIHLIGQVLDKTITSQRYFSNYRDSFFKPFLKTNPQSANFNLKFIKSWRTIADETLSICSASTHSSPSAFPWWDCGNLRITSRRLVITLLDWERCSWCCNPSSNQYLWLLPRPIPSTACKISLSNTLIILSVISGWNQYWSWAYYKWMNTVFVQGQFTTPGTVMINDSHCGSFYVGSI